jgi:hypothetical protein
MSQYLSALFTAILVATAFGCDKSKLYEDLTDDSTWETSVGEEPLESGAVEDPPKRNDEWEEKHDPMDGASPTEEPKPESSLDQSYPRVSTGVIAREALVPVLDGGLGRFLQNVETEPAFHKGAFVGFRILSLFPGEPEFASLDLRPGDTVTRVNGKPIERPEQAIEVWDELRTASKLVVDYSRDGEPHTLRFTIVDEG